MHSTQINLLLISRRFFLFILVFAYNEVQAKTLWSWDCESIHPRINYLVKHNTSIVSVSPHSGKACMQINVSGIGGNQPTGANIRGIAMGQLLSSQTIYYRWWMKLDKNFSWGNGTAKTKASRMIHTDEQLLPKLWTGYLKKRGIALDESSTLPPSWEKGGVFIPYDFQAVSGQGWHEYIVAMKMQNGIDGKNGEFHFFVDSKLIGSIYDIHYLDFDGMCTEAWSGWMVSPYFQLNGTANDGGLLWLDDFSTDNCWNSTYSGQEPTLKK